MRKTLLTLALVFAFSISMFAENVKVLMTDGKEISGKLVKYNE